MAKILLQKPSFFSKPESLRLNTDYRKTILEVLGGTRRIQGRDTYVSALFIEIMNPQHNGGWLELICGSMFSGKTEELLRRIRRAEIARKQIQIFKPAIDHRYGIERVASHNGVARGDALVVANADELLALIDETTQVVAIDEVQFFDWKIADVCDELANRGKRVIAAGLDQDFRGEPFGPMPLLMAMAEQVDKLHAICVVCGLSATRTQRLIDGRPARFDDPIILVGGSESYEARCRHCHEVPGKP